MSRLEAYLIAGVTLALSFVFSVYAREIRYVISAGGRGWLRVHQIALEAHLDMATRMHDELWYLVSSFAFQVFIVLLWAALGFFCWVSTSFRVHILYSIFMGQTMGEIVTGLIRFRRVVAYPRYAQNTKIKIARLQSKIEAREATKLLSPPTSSG